ncbi:hypothetical protein GCM10017566_54870 [Amycolatopsis bartoniae]|uniref:IrrE N-terminal-like domain-containing protein n=2 Tax=Amycolatopsis bartoniae TaxID=941986 RepID=A0A8H9IXG7_9PSEU|nr:hypothetical protein GCM10017566_54870 [Amycolatopsis bartoniae]
MIGINSRHSPKRQRFTIAHELGHWLLHDGKPLIVDQSVMMINKRDDLSSQATNLEEIEANGFAAELLMPRTLMMEAIRRQLSFGHSSREEFVTAIAKEFDVSVDAMGFRLMNLGVFSN